VADVASAIRGIPKDELASEEVRQHRRTVRTAWAAGVVVLLLGIAATVGAIVAVGQSNEAQEQRDEAQRLAEQAEVLRGEAEDARDDAEAQAGIARENEQTAIAEADRADANAAEAQANAAEAARSALAALQAEQLARVRELASAAVANLENEPELATLLALEALDAAPDSDEPPVELINAIWQVGSSNRLLDVIETGYEGDLSLSPDGGRLATTVSPQAVRMYDALSYEVLWEYTEDTVDSFVFPVIGPDGRVALGVLDSDIEWHGSVEKPDDLPNRVIILSPAGDVEARLDFVDCLGAGNTDWSADGRFLAVGYLDVCLREGAAWMEVFDTSTWESVALLFPESDLRIPPSPRFDAAGRLYAMVSFGRNSVYEAETFELVEVTEASGVGDVAPDGSYMYGFYTLQGQIGDGGSPFSVNSYATDTGAIADILYTGIRYPSIPSGVVATDDGRYVIVVAGGFTYFYDPLTGEELLRLPTRSERPVGYDGERDLLYTSSHEGPRGWSLGASNAGVMPTGDLGQFSWVNGNSFVTGDSIGAFLQFDFGSGGVQTGLFDLTTGELTGAVADTGPIAALANGRLVLSISAEGDDAFAIYDPETGDLTRFLECETYDVDGFCTEPGYNLVVSLDGRELLAYPWTEDERPADFVLVLDPETGETLRVDPVDPDSPVIAVLTDEWAVGFPTSRIDYRVFDTASGELLWENVLEHYRHEVSAGGSWLMTRGDIDVQLVDTATWTVRFVVGGFDNIRGTAFNADGTLLAVSDFGAVRIVDIESGFFVQQVQLPGVSDMYFIDDETLVIGTRDGIFGTVSLSTDELVDRTRAGLRRSFTPQECLTYRIDPCPTLEEIKSRG
jgi:WD40 repeat protein